MTIVLGWRGMYAQLLKDKRPRELAQLQEAGELDEVLALASKQAASTYRGIAGKNSTPMQQATAREIVIAQMVEEVEAIPKWSPEETARRRPWSRSQTSVRCSRSTCVSRIARTGSPDAVNIRSAVQ